MGTIGLILILILVGVVYFFSWVSEFIDEGKRLAEKKRERNEKWGDRQIDKTKNLFERNKDIIEKHLKNLRKDSWRYHIENKTSDCIKDIAEAENQSYLAPKFREWLPEWQKRVPAEWVDLKNKILELFKDRYNSLLEKEQADDEKKINNAYEQLKIKNAGLIEQFLEITERKVSVIDSYGEENWDALQKEINVLLSKIYTKERVKEWQKHSWSMPDEAKRLQEYLINRFKTYHKQRAGKRLQSKEINFNEMSGVEFEVFVASLLKKLGFTQVAGTPATGDQGADLLAKKDGKQLVIQAKRYQGSVGNKAVQEVASAVTFYDGDEGWVITNSNFTPSARALAGKANIKLIDGTALEDLINSSVR